MRSRRRSVGRKQARTRGAKRQKVVPWRGRRVRPTAPPTPAAEELHDVTGEAAGGDTVIVGVGASAGGLEAFSQLLQALPPHPGFAMVLVQHLAPTHESALP